MGSDALVFKSISSMEELYGVGRIVLADSRTGETALKDVPGGGLSVDDLSSVSHRIGNLAALCHLRELTASILGPASIARTLALGNGQPSDIIPVSEFPALTIELGILRSCNDEFMKQFVKNYGRPCRGRNPRRQSDLFLLARVGLTDSASIAHQGLMRFRVLVCSGRGEVRFCGFQADAAHSQSTCVQRQYRQFCDMQSKVRRREHTRQAVKLASGCKWTQGISGFLQAVALL